MKDYIDRQLLQELKQFALDHGARWARIDQKYPAIVGEDQLCRPFRLVVDGMANEWRHALKQFARMADAEECAGLKRFLRISQPIIALPLSRVGPRNEIESDQWSW